jgi:hypothetical protein
VDKNAGTVSQTYLLSSMQVRCVKLIYCQVYLDENHVQRRFDCSNEGNNVFTADTVTTTVVPKAVIEDANVVPETETAVLEAVPKAAIVVLETETVVPKAETFVPKANVIMMESDAQKENVPPINHDTPGHGMMQSRMKKIDPKHLPTVVVEITPRSQYCLACKIGVLIRLLCHGDFLHEPNKTDVLLNWRTMNKVGIRTGSAAVAPSGGHGYLQCNCSGSVTRSAVVA